MIRTFITLLLLIPGFSSFPQDKVTDTLKTLLHQQAYDKIILEYAGKPAGYPAKALYYIGLAYYMKEDNLPCLRFMDLSIAKDSGDAAAYYIKASTLNYMEKYAEAVPIFQRAIALKANDADFYSGLGDAYYNLVKDEQALEAYLKATEQPDCPGRPYFLLGQLYNNRKQSGKALEAYYTARSKLSKQSHSYTNVLFNIGLLESLQGNYDKAEPFFLEVIALDTADYHSHAKLIQIYYHQKAYDKAALYKAKLYEAHRKDVLKDNLQDMFCFDQFKWKQYSVLVFERYENENKGRIYNKHLFYVTDTAGEVVFQVQTEFSPISVEMNGPKYSLCANKGTTHYNAGIGFNDDFQYENLKAAAIKLMEQHVE